MLRLYNSKGRKKEVFKPLRGNKVRMYSCGPTVYNFAHIGNLRAFLFADLVKRYLKWSGYEVLHVMNITDVDDKIIRDSAMRKISARELAQEYEKGFFEDVDLLGIERADEYPRATAHIQYMVVIIKKLLKKGIAYKGEDGSIYFDITKFKKYGEFAGLDVKSLKKGARIKHDEYAKNSIQDFAVWKAYDEEDGDVFWETDIGKGRPGWHIECSAMSEKYLGQPFDIHTGGVDLIFPHHQNEIAQSEGANEKELAMFWVHNEHLLVDGRKMSKSLGNFYTLRDLLDKGVDCRSLRLTLLSAHHRQQFNYSEKTYKSWSNALERVDGLYNELVRVAGWESKNMSKYTSKCVKWQKGSKFENSLKKAMDDDLNTSKTLGKVFEYIKLLNKSLSEMDAGTAKKAITELNSFYYIFGISKPELEVKAGQRVLALVEEREKARAEKEFQRADSIRDEIAELGFNIDDTAEGPRLRKI